jgi:hypothetical protein
MHLEQIRTRVMPALITALGVVLVTAGLLTYVDPTTAGTLPDQSPVVETLAPSATPSATPRQTLAPDGSPSASPTSPIASLRPTPAPIGRAVATRLVVPALNIDLPVIRGPAGYPPCGVAMYLKELGQPGEGRAIYLYAHVQRGMMLPLLEQSKIRNGRNMLGMVVQVYTSHNMVYTYEIFEVRRHQRTLDRVLAARSEELWMQTSEGPNASYPKLQVVARPIGSPVQADPAEANPKARPVAC